MALKNLVKSGWEYDYYLEYEREDSPGNGGFMFPCDKDGKVKPFDNPHARENYAMCLGGNGYTFLGITEYRNRVPAHGECECGREIWLYSDHGHGIDCDKCGRIYNSSGQELRPRSQWEERYDDDSTQPYWAEFGYHDE